MKDVYHFPDVLQSVSMNLDGDILVGSVVDNIATVESTGQQVETYDFSTDAFNSTWE